MELLLIRHGLPLRRQTDDGSAADPPLSERGRAQAEAMARWLADERFDALYASPMLRARETAEPLARAQGLELRIEPGVAEFDAESDVYVPLEQVKEEDPARWKEMIDTGFYLGGDAAVFRDTVIDALDGLVAAHAGERIAVVCHGGVINAWVSTVLEVSKLFLFEPDYTSVHRFLVARSGEKSLKSLNESAHLRGLSG